MKATPFYVNVPQTIIDDLNIRLEKTRWPDEVLNSGWNYGTNLAYMKELLDYWRTKFDWRAQEQFINRFHHFRANLGGLNIHFIHERKWPEASATNHQSRMAEFLLRDVEDNPTVNGPS